VQNGVATLASEYGHRGWKIVRLYGVVEPGVCTCWKGRDCATPGKHPQGEAWHLSATSDEDTILGWFDGPKPVNIGLLLGPASGVIDVELDGDDAKKAWAALGLGEIWTPTYTAGRGPHRLFKWDEGLPATAVRKVHGIEVRIGNGGSAAQSVIPPSTHHTGKVYEWVTGLSPDDVDLQPLPEKLANLLWNDDGSGQRLVAARKPARALLHQPVKEGGRNDELYRFAVRESFRAGPDLDDPTEQQDLLMKVRMVNSTQCRPPMDDSEVMAIYRSAIGYVRKSRAAGMDQATAIAQAEASSVKDAAKGKPIKADKASGIEKVFTATGLSYTPVSPTSDPEWWPGEWRLTVVHSDPLEYRLHVPAWKQFTSNGTGNVSLTVDQYRSATKVAASVLAATGVVMLDKKPGDWKRIWDGGYKIEVNKGTAAAKKESAEGVKSKLLDNAGHEWPGASSLRYVLLAGWLYDRLSQASQPSDDDIPDPTGRAAWRADGSLWFSWGKVWEDIERQHRVNEGERLALKRRLLALLDGEKDFQHLEFRHLGGARKSYVVWSRREFAVLEELATSDPGSPDSASEAADPAAGPPAT
jgi:hypothetical protein